MVCRWGTLGGVGEEGRRGQSVPGLFGLTRRELWWPIAVAIVVLLINKLVIHDGGSFFGSVLINGFWVGVIAVVAVKWLVRRANAG